MSTITEARVARGWTMAELARRLGMTTSAVSQMEKAENEGTITLNTLARALEPFSLVPTVQAANLTALQPVGWDPAIAQGFIVDPIGPRKTILDARFGDRVVTIAGECLALGTSLTIDQLWLVADHVSVQAPLLAYDQARTVMFGYDKLLRLVDQGRWVPRLSCPDGRRIPVPSDTSDPALILEWALTGIANGAGWLESIRAASALLVQQGIRWPVLPARASFRAEWEYAVGAAFLAARGDRLASLIVAASRGELR